MLNIKNKKLNSHETQKFYFWSLILVIVFCLFSYGYFVHGAIVNIVERQNMENNLGSLSARVIDLESQYIKAKNNVTEEFAYSLGYVSASNQKFVTRSVDNSGLSLVTVDF